VRPPIVWSIASLSVAWIALLLSLVYLYRQLGAAGAALDLWISSDTLYPVNVFMDIFQDGYSLSGWQFSIAPCWFPDLFSAGLFWAVTADPISATLLAGFIQIALMLGAFGIFRRALGNRRSAIHDLSLIGVAIAITLWVAAHPGQRYPGLFQFFLPQTHVGSLLMVLYGLGLGLLCVKAHEENRRVRWIAGVYGVICFLAGMSNVLFFANMLVPLTISLCAGTRVGIVPARSLSVPLLAGWPAAIAGAVSNRVFVNTAGVSAQSGMSVDRILLSFEVFVRGIAAKVAAFDILHMLALLWIAVCLAFVLTGLRTANRSGRMAWLFFSSCLLSSLAGPAVVILGGSNGLAVFKDYTWTMHYLHSTFFVPFFGLPFAASCVLRPRNDRLMAKAAAVAAFAAAAAPAYALGVGPRPAAPAHQYVPPLVRFMDEIAVEHGLKYGVAGYWQARPLTLLSKTGVRAYAVDELMNPLLWVSNRQWYRELFKKRTLDFVILDPMWRIGRDNAVRVFGEPASEVLFQNARILIYSKIDARR
jgi:hypothetical protein